MGILILSPGFPFPFYSEVISEASDVSENRSVESDGVNSNDDDKDHIPRGMALGIPSASPARLHDRSNAIDLVITARKDDGETLFGTDMRTTIAPWHLRGLELDIGIESGRLVAFTIIGEMREAGGCNASGLCVRGCRRVVPPGLGGGSGASGAPLGAVHEEGAI
jgi:hypothetical protein